MLKATMPGTPEVGFSFGVEGDQSLLAAVKQLREELKGLKEGQDRVAASAEGLKRAWEGLVQLAEVLAIAELAKEAFDAAVAIGKLEQITGISARTLSVYRKAANDVGIEHELLDKGLMRLSRSLIQLQNGNTQAAQAYALLGLRAKDFQGLKPDEALRLVTDRLGQMQDGAQKAAAAQTILGRGGAVLLPVFKELAGEGFAEAAAQAEKLGIIFDHDFVESALRARASLQEVKDIAVGATAQFEAGFIPAMADVADSLVKAASSGGNGFKTLGEMAGTAFKYIFGVLQSFAITVGGTAQVIIEDFGYAWETVKLGAVSVFDAFNRAAHGDFAGALAAIRTGFNNASREYEEYRGRLDAIDKTHEKLQEEATRALFNSDRPTPKLPRPGVIEAGFGRDQSVALAREQLTALRRQADDELALYRAHNQRLQAEDKAAYEAGSISLEEYFTRRRAAIEKEFTLEVASLNTEKTGLVGVRAQVAAAQTLTPAEEAAKKKEILAIDQQIAHIENQMKIDAEARDKALFENDRAETDEKRNKQIKALEMEKQLAELEGNRHKATEANLKLEELRFTALLRALGFTSARISAKLDEFRSAEGARATGAIGKTGFEEGLAGIEGQKAAIEGRAASGSIFAFQAEKALHDLLEREIPLLQKKIDLMREAQAKALAAGDVDLANQLGKDADSASVKLEKLRVELVKTADDWQKFRTGLKQTTQQALTSGLDDFFTRQIFQAKSLGQAFQQLGLEIARTFEAYVAHALVAYAVKKLLGALFPDNAQNGPQQKANQTIAANVAVASSDAGVSAAEAFMYGLADSGGNIAAAAAQAAIAYGIGLSFAGLAAFARGGYVGAQSLEAGGGVYGPGSSTSDSIPAWLSDGEYVVNAGATRRFGRDALDAINRGALLPAFRSPAPYGAFGFRLANGARSEFADRGGGTTNNFSLPTHIGELSALDGASVRAALEEHGDLIGKIAVTHVKRHFRTNGVGG